VWYFFVFYLEFICVLISFIDGFYTTRVWKEFGDIKFFDAYKTQIQKENLGIILEEMHS